MRKWIKTSLLLCFTVGILLSGCDSGTFLQVKKETDVLKISMGEMSQTLSPVFYSGEEDKNLLSILYSSLLTTDRNGSPVLQAVSDNITLYGGEEYSNPGVADISVEKKEKQTVYTISLRRGIRTGKGEELNAEDLLFNYYLRFDASFRGQTISLPIVGLEEYQYNTYDVKKRKKEIEKLMFNPSTGVKKQINRQIIYPVLKEELQWVKSLYQNSNYEKYTEKYKEPLELFSYFYSLDTTYQVKDNLEKKVLSEIAGQYDWQYKKLSEVTGDNYDSLAERIVLHSLLQEKDVLQSSEVSEIEGIKKIDDYTIEIIVQGYEEENLKDLCDIYLLPLDEFGDRSSFEKGQFGFQKGDVSEAAEKTLSSVQGTGAYYVEEAEGDTYYLKENKNYWKGKGKIPRLVIYARESDINQKIKAMKEGSLDIACLNEVSTQEEYEIKQLLEEEPASYLVARRQGILFSTERVNATSIAKHITKSYPFWMEISQLRMN